MQTFLKSDDPPETVLAKLETEHGETDEETPEERALNTCFDVGITVKFLNFSDTRKLCCNIPKIQTKRQNLTVFCHKDAK